MEKTHSLALRSNFSQFSLRRKITLLASIPAFIIWGIVVFNDLWEYRWIPFTIVILFNAQALFDSFLQKNTSVFDKITSTLGKVFYILVIYVSIASIITYWDMFLPLALRRW